MNDLKGPLNDQHPGRAPPTGLQYLLALILHRISVVHSLAEKEQDGPTDSAVQPTSCLLSDGAVSRGLTAVLLSRHWPPATILRIDSAVITHRVLLSTLLPEASGFLEPQNRGEGLQDRAPGVIRFAPMAVVSPFDRRSTSGDQNPGSEY
ncbi:hypothetical protein AAFF_G00018850 [Aldrovandia affinis]|uniref:Uncharacterized protein n=1 Tax=Aldrovandia affinis TaxID=143900 RepID=A0AAD7S5G5_9TELE|nr:hypothetical protein AAFF_G00018850 [Aldrovandia affinis]